MLAILQQSTTRLLFWSTWLVLMPGRMLCFQTTIHRASSSHYRQCSTTVTTQLAAQAAATLKPAAAPLMDAGKALARTGELLIDVTTELDLYGGALSAAGAEVRNAGDAVA